MAKSLRQKQRKKVYHALASALTKASEALVALAECESEEETTTGKGKSKATISPLEANPWTVEELTALEAGLKKYGNDAKKIQEELPSQKPLTQVKTFVVLYEKAGRVEKRKEQVSAENNPNTKKHKAEDSPRKKSATKTNQAKHDAKKPEIENSDEEEANQRNEGESSEEYDA